MNRPEQATRTGIRNLLRQVGFSVYDMEQNRPTRQTPGFSDLVALGHGRILFVEVKSRNGRLTPRQLEFYRDVARNGGTHLLWRSTEQAWRWLVEEGVVSEAT